MPLATRSELKKAATHLDLHDPVLALVIRRAGLAQLQPHTDYCGALVNSIIGQQLSVKAATSIKQRFQGLFGGLLPSPEQILTKSIEELRAIGLSNAKAGYIRDLAQHIIGGKVRFDTLNQQSNEEIIAELTDVKGIGEWTAQMFLMFCMGRLDILPVGDLGIKNGVRNLYGLDAAPSPEQIRHLAKQNNWHPYESAASWYIWNSLDNSPA